MVPLLSADEGLMRSSWEDDEADGCGLILSLLIEVVLPASAADERLLRTSWEDDDADLCG